MSGLLNAEVSTETLTTYDRAYAGSFENPFGGVPKLTFNMQRITVRDRDQVAITSTNLSGVSEGYVPGKTYQLKNPVTGDDIPGATFTSDQLYAMIYSTMIRAKTYQDLCIAAEAAEITLRTATTALQQASYALTAAQSMLLNHQSDKATAQTTLATAEQSLVSAQTALDADPGNTDLAAEVTIAQSNVAVSQANLAIADTAVVTAQATVTTAQANVVSATAARDAAEVARDAAVAAQNAI